MRACERLLKYVRVNTQSSEGTGVTPSTPGQWDLARLLVDELTELGLENPSVNEFCTVTAWLPATPGLEHAPALGLLAHLDTAPAFSGKDVNPIVHEHYDGGDIVLPKEGRVIRAADFPWLSRLQGKTVITADGSTLLGADDKAGVAEIVTLCGKHCESGDAVVIDMPLQHPDLGDIVCVFGTGAYNMTMASNYNGQPRPAVVFVRDGQARVVTRRETYNDLYARDI